MKTESIQIGKVTVPLLDYAVSCTAILGIRDSGKTVTAKGIAEQLLDHGIPIVVFDAVGKWRWMKVPAEGNRGRGYKVVVAGGRAPDLPLTPHSVSEIVRSSIKEKIPLIIDLYDSKLSKADWRRIVQQSIRIIHYEANGVAHVFLEEAAEFIPQKVMDGETYAEVEKLARMGGNASVGITLINQRSQEVNKAVLDLAHNLVLGCQIGNKAIEAVGKWVDRLSPDIASKVAKSLPHLESGEAWVWTRSNPDEPSLERMPMCRSLHPDRRTPDVVLKTAKAIDPDEFVQRLSDSIPKVIEEAKANDPALLKAEVRKLRAELAKGATTTTEIKEVQRPVFDDKDRKLISKAIAGFEMVDQTVKAKVEELRDIYRELNTLRGTIEVLIGRQKQIPSMRQPVKKTVNNNAIRMPLLSRQSESENGSSELGKPERRVLAVLAQYEDGCEIGKLALLSGYRISGGFRNILSALRTSGLISGENTGIMQITSEGFSHGPFEQLPGRGEEFVQFWLSHPRLGNPEKRVLQVLIDNPEGLSLEELAEKSEYEVSGGFRNITSTLRTAGLIEGRNTERMKAADEFFP